MNDKSSSTNHQPDSIKAPPQSRPSKAASTPTAAASSTSGPTTTQPSQPAATATSSNTARTPEATLFIRNIPDKTQESDIRTLFEPRGLAVGCKVLTITLNTHRGFCFVDFDGPAAVGAIVEEASKSLVKDQRTGRKIESAFMVHGRVLEVERKVPSSKSSGGGGGGGGSGGASGGYAPQQPPENALETHRPCLSRAGLRTRGPSMPRWRRYCPPLPPCL